MIEPSEKSDADVLREAIRRAPPIPRHCCHADRAYGPPAFESFLVTRGPLNPRRIARLA